MVSHKFCDDRVGFDIDVIDNFVSLEDASRQAGIFCFESLQYIFKDIVGFVIHPQDLRFFKDLCIKWMISNDDVLGDAFRDIS